MTPNGTDKIFIVFPLSCHFRGIHLMNDELGIRTAISVLMILRRRLSASFNSYGQFTRIVLFLNVNDVFFLKVFC